MISIDERILYKITETIYRISEGEKPVPVELPLDYPNNEIKQMVSCMNKMIVEYNHVADFMYSLSKGELNYIPSKGKMKILQSSKAMQSNLRHLTWKTQQIATGDFNQKVDFMGDFSDAFNKMTNQLTDTFEKLGARNQKLHQANEMLYQISRTDELTGIANRRHFDELFETEWRRAARLSKPVSVILIDIDFFKNYNDTYGHQMGDECLKRVANALKIAIKRPCDILARYGGEEFIVLLSDTDGNGAAKVAETMQSNVAALSIAHKNSHVGNTVTVSFGISSMVPEINGSPELLIAKADSALYQAKHEGRNRIKL